MAATGAVRRRGGMRRAAANHHGPEGNRGDHAMLVTTRVLQRDDTFAGPTAGQSFGQHPGLGVQRVTGVHRCRETDVTETQVCDDRALGQLVDGQPDQGGQRQHAVDQSRAERLPRTPVGIEMQGLRIHRQGGEQSVVRLTEGPARGMPVDHVRFELLEPQSTLLDHAVNSWFVRHEMTFPLIRLAFASAAGRLGISASLS